MIKFEHFRKVNASQTEEDEAKQHETNEDAPMIFPSKVKFSDFVLLLNTTKTKSIKINIKSFKMADRGYIYEINVLRGSVMILLTYQLEFNNNHLEN